LLRRCAPRNDGCSCSVIASGAKQSQYDEREIASALRASQ